MRRAGLIDRRAPTSYGRVPLIGGGGGGAAPSADTPATIMGANCLHWWRADLDNTIAVDGNWVDQVGALVLAQATEAARPTQSASGGPNSTSMMTFDGTDDALSVALVRAAPGTTPAAIWFIFRQDAWTTTESLFNDSGTAFAVQQITTEPRLRLFNGTAAANNDAGTVGSWFRGQAYFSNSTSDELMVGATVAAASVSSGNAAGTALLIARNVAGTTFTAISLAEVALFDAKPSAGQKTSLDAYVTSRYGAGLV